MTCATRGRVLSCRGSGLGRRRSGLRQIRRILCRILGDLQRGQLHHFFSDVRQRRENIGRETVGQRYHLDIAGDREDVIRDIDRAGRTGALEDRRYPQW